MLTISDVYISFKRAEALVKGKTFKEPSNFSGIWNKMSVENREIVTTLSNHFNTKWSSIDPEGYFLAGFKLWKSFKWDMALRKDIIQKYIQIDKTKKRNISDTLDNIENDIHYIISSFKSINNYCEHIQGNVSLPIMDYVKRKITGTTLFLLNKKGYIQFTEHDRIYILYLLERKEQYEDHINQLGDIQWENMINKSI